MQFPKFGIPETVSGFRVGIGWELPQSSQSLVQTKTMQEFFHKFREEKKILKNKKAE
ncbi:hypothetical protein C1H46_030855 [Malus baccata]|uniref:Uncharacterized protein n=1 Tax=Malus baccata TaxID=106549 RepID=A0A540LAX6_MALBA|nr:hypothetical protein C1H46_030855 [Malus baccata]